MTWLYVAMAGAVVARWGLWYLRDAIEWLETSHREQVSPAMLARLRQQANGSFPVPRLPVPHLSGGTVSGPRGA